MESVLVSRHWPACADGVVPEAWAEREARAVQDAFARAIRDLRALRAMRCVSEGARAKIVEATRLLQEAEEEQGRI